MRLRKDEQPLSIEEHEKIASVLLGFISGMESIQEVLGKGFAEKSPISRKLNNMLEIANFLKYSLQQAADMHKKKVEGETVPELDQKWSKVYLGER